MGDKIARWCGLCLCWFVLTCCGVGGPGESASDAGVDARPFPPGVKTISATEIRETYVHATLGQVLIDLRDEDSYKAGHLPRAVNVPLETVWRDGQFVANGQAIFDAAPVKDKPVILYGTASQAPDIGDLALALGTSGYTDVMVLKEGIEAWEAQGYFEDIELEVVRDVYYPQLSSGSVFLVDSNEASLYQEGHIAGAVNVDGLSYWDTVNEQLIDDGKALTDVVGCDAEVLIFYCVNEGCPEAVIGAEGAEHIPCLDHTRLYHFAGGLEAWQEAGLPIACGSDPNGPCE